MKEKLDTLLLFSESFVRFTEIAKREGIEAAKKIEKDWRSNLEKIG